MATRSIRSVEQGRPEAINTLRQASGAERAQAITYLTGRRPTTTNLASVSSIARSGAAARFGARGPASTGGVHANDSAATIASALDSVTRATNNGAGTLVGGRLRPFGSLPY